MIINFCTQVCNRRHQLELTLPHNLQILEGTLHKLVLLVIKGTDGTFELVKGLKHPNLIMYHIDMPYDIIQAKNIVHNLASGDYLFNLDADNFISKQLIKYINHNKNIAIHNWSGNTSDGSYGRIGMPTSWYHAVGGYPNYMIGAGAHDYVFIHLLATVGKIITIWYMPKLPIANDKAATVANLPNCSDWSMINDSNLERFSKQPIFVPRLTINLRANSFGADTGHVTTMWRNLSNHAAVDHKLRYWVTFSEGFDFGLGGKLPGFGYGDIPTCGNKGYGWSARPIWRTDGEAGLYVYHPAQSGFYGDSFKLPFKFVSGVKHLLELSYANEQVSLKINGYVISIPLDNPPSQVLYHIFRGGHTADWASSSDGSIKIEPAA